MLHLIGHFLSFIGYWLKSAPGFLNKSPGDRPLAQQHILLQNKQTTSQCIGDRSANAKGKTGKIVCTFPVLHFLQINYWALRLCKAIFLRNVTYFRDRVVIAVLNMFNFIVNLYSQSQHNDIHNCPLFITNWRGIIPATSHHHLNRMIIFSLKLTSPTEWRLT